MKRFIKQPLLHEADSVAKLIKIDVNNKESQCNYKKVDVGVGAKKALSQAKLSDAQILSFRMECLKFLSATAAKIIERSPLKYPLVRAVSCLAPNSVVNSQVVAEKRMRNLVQTMYEKGYITSVVADKCVSQFGDLCSKASGTFRSKFSGFNRSSDRLDTFYYSILGQDPEFTELFYVVRLVLTLSHGNACVESGFSINDDMLVENLHEDSLIAQRIVYDEVQSAGGIASIKLDIALLSYVRGSHARYEQALSCRRKAEDDASKKLAATKRAEEQIRNLKAKKAKLMQDTTAEAHKMDLEIAELEKVKH